MADSVIGAVIAKWAGLSFPGKPGTLWFGSQGVPLRNPDGTAVTLPTAQLVHHGTTPEYDTEYNPLEVTRFTFTVRAVTLAEAQSVAAGIRYNGGAVNARLGYDFGTLTLTGQTLKSMVREREQEDRETSAHDPEGRPVHRIDLDYSAQTLRTA